MDNYLFLPRALAAAFYDAAFASALGLVLAKLWLARDAEPALHTRFRRTTFLCATSILLALCAQSYLTTATMIGASALADVRLQLATVLTDTHAGRNILACTALVLVFLLALTSPRRAQSGTDTWITLGLLTTLAAVRAASGHAAADGDFTLPEYVQFAHLISIAIWAGSVIAAGLIVLPTLNPTDTLTFTRKLSRTVTVALLFILLSGIYNSYRGLGGSLKPLATTQWGYLLDAKLALVLIALAMGALNRRTLQTNSTLTPQLSIRLTAVLRVEAIVMLLILILSAFLANSPPANMGDMPM